MKTHFAAVLTILLTLPFLADPAAGDTKSDSDSARIKALEAEIAALRAQLRAESGIRSEDRGRDRRGEAERQERERREHERREHERREQERRMHDHGGEHGDHDRHEHSEHHVMHFDLLDLTRGEMEGEVHIEISGDMDGMPGFLPELIMRQMDGHRGGPMPGMMHGGEPHVALDHHDMHHGHHADMHHDEMHDALYEHVVVIMEEHGMPMEMLEEVGMAMEEHGMGPMEALHMLIERLDEEGVDPRPLIDLMEEISHDDGHHEEDPFFQQGGEFVGKMDLANRIGISLADPIDVAIFGVWEARQHLEPQERVDLLGSIMADTNIDMSVRNAAAMVVREALYELGDRQRALETLHMQIRLNGMKPGQPR